LTVLDAAASCNPPDANGGSALLVEPIELGVPKTIHISPGQRTFSVVAFDGSTPVARGCDRLNLIAGETHTVHIDLVEYPEDIDAGVSDGGLEDAGVPDSGTGPDGDICESAVTLSPGTLYNQPWGADYTNAESGSCGGDGRDRVYTFTTFTARQVEIETIGNLQHVLYVRAADCASGAEVACEAASGAGTYTASFQELSLPAGVYYVFVDATNAGETGQFQITLTLSDPVPDICSSAEEIPLDTTTTGTLVNAGNDYAGACGGASGAEVVYSFTLDEVSRIRATATRTSGSFDPVVYLRSDCPTPSSEPIGGCADESTGAVEEVDVDYLGPGTHYVFVDSAGGVAGTFELLVEKLPAPPTNDRCSGAKTMSEGVTENGTTEYARDDTTGDCTTGNVDVFYELTLAQPRRVLIDLTNATTEHALYVQGTCGDYATQIACSSTVAADERIEFLNLDAGTYTVVVEAEAGGTGTFDLVYNTFQPVPNDTCTAPIPLEDGVPRTGDTTVGARDAETASCDGGGSTPDVIYSYTLTEDRTVELSVTTDFDAAVSIRNPSCSEAGDEVVCADNVAAAATEAINFRRQAAGTYYVVVDGVGGATGVINDITLTTSQPPPAGDDCPESVLMNHNSTLVGEALSTDYADDDGGSCGGTGGADRVYSFVLSGEQQVSISTANATFDHVLYLRTADCEAGTEQSCQQATDVGGGDYEASLTFGALPAGTYYVWVDALAPTGAETFDITLTVTGVVYPPVNDECANATTLAENLTEPGTLDAATNDETSACVSGPQSDVFYRFILSEPRRVVINLTSATNTALSLMSGDCGSLTELFCLDDTGAGEMLDIGYLPAGTYYVMVEGVAGAQGAFNVGYSTSSPRPDNDQCWGSETLTHGVWVTGETTVNALNDVSSACGGDNGPDVVYDFTILPGQSRRVRITVENASGFDPIIAVFSGACESGTEVDCAQRATGADDMLDIPSLAPGTYYVWIDGATSAAGTFDVRVEILPEVPPPSYDTCASPDPLAVNVDEGPFSTVGASDDYSLACVAFDTRDTVHSLSLASDSALLLRATAADPAWNLAMSLRTDCSSGPDLACVNNAFNPHYINLPSASAGDYSVIIDGDTGAAGDYNLFYTTRATDSTFGYWVLASTGTYTYLTSANQVPISYGNDGDSWYVSLSLPFSFDYFGTTYPSGTSLLVTDDGYAKFGSYNSGSDSWLNDCLDDTVPNDTLAVFWDDGIAWEAPASLSYKTEGSSPNRRFIVQWKDFDVVGPAPHYYIVRVKVNHQLVLFENGDIEFRYGPRQTPSPDDEDCLNQQLGCSATIGIEAGEAGDHDADLVDCNQENTFDGRVLHFVHPTN